jgi:hypothetical protein
MLINRHRNVIIMFAASFALFAQSNDFPVKSQDHSGVPDARQIIESSIAATQRYWQVRLHYTYLERDESRRRDLAGREFSCASFTTSSSIAASSRGRPINPRFFEPSNF